jgi:hypothetical protein
MDADTKCVASHPNVSLNIDEAGLPRGLPPKPSAEGDGSSHTIQPDASSVRLVSVGGDGKQAIRRPIRMGQAGWTGDRNRPV